MSVIRKMEVSTFQNGIKYYVRWRFNPAHKSCLDVHYRECLRVQDWCLFLLMRFMINPKAPKWFLSVLIPIMIFMTQIRVEVRVGLKSG